MSDKITYFDKVLRLVGDPKTITYYRAGQTISFVDGKAHLVDPSPIQLALADEKIKAGEWEDVTPTKKIKATRKRTAKKGG